MQVLLIADVDGDGKKELLVGKTDREVIAYRWARSKRHFEKVWTSHLPGQVGSLAVVNTEHECGVSVAVSQPGATFMLIDGSTGEASDPRVAMQTSTYRYSEQGAATEIAGLRSGLVAPNQTDSLHRAANSTAAASKLENQGSVAAKRAEQGSEIGAPAGSTGAGSTASAKVGAAQAEPAGSEQKDSSAAGDRSDEDALARRTCAALPDRLVVCTSPGLLSLGTNTQTTWELNGPNKLLATT